MRTTQVRSRRSGGIPSRIARYLMSVIFIRLLANQLYFRTKIWHYPTVHRLCSAIFASMFPDELWNGVDRAYRLCNVADGS